MEVGYFPHDVDVRELGPIFYSEVGRDACVQRISCSYAHVISRFNNGNVVRSLHILTGGLRNCRLRVPKP